MHFRRCNLIIESTYEKIVGIFVDNKLHFTEHIL